MELTTEEVFNHAECVLNSLDEVTKAMIKRGNDRDKRHAVDYVNELIYDLYPDLTEDNFRGIFNAVYNSIICGPNYIGNRFAS